MVLNKQDKVTRVLSIFERLNQGKVIRKHEEAERFGVDQKTIQRDIEDVRRYLDKMYSSANLVEYNRKRKGYVLYHDKHVWLTNEEVLVMAKVLLESRAFTENELNNLLDKIVLQCAPEERRHIKKVILNERFHYVPVNHGQPLLEKIWDLSFAVRLRKRVEIGYKKVRQSTVVRRIIEPQGIIFSEYYFYLIAYIHGYAYEFPAVYRLDRIVNYRILKDNFPVIESQRFEEGEFRKRVQFMKAGPIIRIK